MQLELRMKSGLYIANKLGYTFAAKVITMGNYNVS